MLLLVSKSPWLFVCVCCECVCCWDHLCEFALAWQVWMSLTETLCECYVCVSVWWSLRHIVYECKKKSTRVCVCLCVAVCCGDAFVSLYGGTKGECLCCRPSVSVCVCECVCV